MLWETNPGGVPAGPSEEDAQTRTCHHRLLRLQLDSRRCLAPASQMASRPRVAAANFSCWRLRALFLKFHVYLKPDFQMSSSALKSDFFLLQLLKAHLVPHSSQRGKLRLTRAGSMAPLASGTKRSGVRVSGHPWCQLLHVRRGVWGCLPCCHPVSVGPKATGPLLVQVCPLEVGQGPDSSSHWVRRHQVACAALASPPSLLFLGLRSPHFFSCVCVGSEDVLSALVSHVTQH